MSGCTGEWSGDPAGGRDFDCDYEFPPICEDCIYGPAAGAPGLINPETGKEE